VAGPAYERAGGAPAAFDTHNPPDPRHYLAFRGVRPDPQNRGIGSALRNRHHARLDRAGLPAHLEANDHHNRDHHLRQGHLSRPANQMADGSSLWSKRRSPMD
jgi:GNAT superfamily N-acetyltransferase